MTHTDIQNLLSAYALDELAATEKTTIAEHLEECKGCREELARMKAILGIAKSMKTHSAEAKVCQSVLDAANQIASDTKKQLVFRSPWVRAAVAALVILGAVLMWTALTEKKDKRIVKPDPQQQALPNGTEGVQPETLPEDVTANQPALAGQLYEARNVAALAALFEAGDTQTKLAVVNYLAKIGTDEAFEALQMLDVSDSDSLVQQAVKEQLDAAESSGPRTVDANPVEASEKAAADANEPKAATPTNTAPAEPSTAAANEQGSKILIKVVEKESGQPIVAADIRTYDRGSKHFKTDAAGLCTVMAGLNGGTCINLFAAKDGFVGQSFTCGEGRLVDYFPKEVLFELDKGTMVGGVIHGSDGKPLEGATVSFDIHNGIHDDKPGNDERFRQKTGPDGRWHCRNAPANLEKCSVGASHPDYASNSTSATNGDTAQQLRDETHVLTMDAGYTISGTVKDEAGNLIKGTRIQLGEYYFFKQPDERTHTDKNGTYEFKRLRITQTGFQYAEVEGQGRVPVRYPMEYVTASAKGFAPQLVRLYFKENQMQLDFVLTAGEPIYGRVIDFEGQPVAGVTVRAGKCGYEQWDALQSFDWNTKTDADGRFVWQHAPDRPVQLVISKDGYLTLETEKVTPTETEYEFVINPQVRVAGQVIDAVTQKPVSEFIFRRHGGGHTTDRKRVTDSEGRFETAFDDQGETFTISFEADGYKPTSSRAISLIEQDVELTIEMTPDAGVNGIVVDTDGQPLEGVRVMIPGSYLTIDNLKFDPSRYQYVPNTLTDTQGRFHLDPVAGEEFRLLAIEETGYLYLSSAEFPKDGRFILQPYATITGTYYKGTKPQANTRIRIDYPHYHQIQKDANTWVMGTAFNFNTQTDDQGNYTFDKLIGGTARILVKPYKEVELTAGEVKEIHLGGDGQMVSGHLLNPHGQPLNEEFGSIALGLQPTFSTMPIPEEDWPLPDNADAMSYAQIMTWLMEFVNSDAGRQWLEEMKPQYGDLSRDYSSGVDANGRFEMADVRPGTYLLSLTVYAWKDPDQFPRQRDYSKIIAKGSAVVTVPDFVAGDIPETPIDMGTLASRTAPLTAGDPAPAFEIDALMTSGTIRLCDFRGKRVLVNFTNPMLNNAEPDKAALLEQACEKAKDKMTILNIATELLPWEYMRAKMRAECTLPGVYGVAMAHQSKISDDYQPEPLPTSVLIDADGKIVWKGATSTELLEVIDQQLK